MEKYIVIENDFFEILIQDSLKGYDKIRNEC